MSNHEYDVIVAPAPQHITDMLFDKLFGLHIKFVDHLTKKNSYQDYTESCYNFADIDASNAFFWSRRQIKNAMKYYKPGIIDAVPYGCYYILDYQDTFLVWTTSSSIAMDLRGRLNLISINMNKFNVKHITL